MTPPAPPSDDRNVDAIDQALIRLLASAPRPSPPDGFTRPPEADVMAYVQGRANADQKLHVREAIHASEAFGREILDDMEAEKHLQDPSLREDMRRVKIPDRLRAALASATSEPDPRSRPSVSARVRSWLWRPAFGYALAAAMAVVALLDLGAWSRLDPLNSPAPVVIVAESPEIGRVLGSGPRDRTRGIASGDAHLSSPGGSGTDPGQVEIRVSIPDSIYASRYIAGVKRIQDPRPEYVFFTNAHDGVSASGDSIRFTLRVDARSIVPGNEYEVEFEPVESPYAATVTARFRLDPQ